MNKDSKIYIAGHRGLVGSALHRRLIADGYTNLVFKTSAEMDLTDQQAVYQFFKKEKPEYVFLIAARAGGVAALNDYKADSIHINLMIQNNVIHNSYVHNVKKLLFLGSNCVYPKLAVEPLKEEYLLAGKLEPTTEYYAVAKIAGIKMCEAYRLQHGCNFITALPVNMYGPNDNDDPEKAHVVAALLGKFKTGLELDGLGSSAIEVWGTGSAQREFMHVDDLIEACLILMDVYNELEPVNVGTGKNTTIKELVELMKEVTGYKGGFEFNPSKPDGVGSKVFNLDKIHKLGWKHKIELKEGLTEVWENL